MLLSLPSQAIKVTLLYMPSHLLLPVFRPCGHSKASMLEQGAVREAITKYVKTMELVPQDNPR
jgi:hypothetical protein